MDEAFDNETVIVRVPEEGTGGVRLDAYLAGRLPELSRSRVQTLLKSGAVRTAAGRVLKVRDKVAPGEEVMVEIPPPAPIEPQPQNIPLDIVFEDEHCIVVDKPAGLCVHPSPGHPDGTLVNALLFHCPNLPGIGGFERPGIVHRLDKDTSGLMVVAKSDAAMMGFSEMFKSRGVSKEYLCLVHGAPPQNQGTLDNLIGRHPVLRQHYAVVARNGKRAISHYTLIEHFRRISLVRVKIDTGRTHQIRVHMAHLRCPIIGDGFYGRKSADIQLDPPPLRQMLHAAHLSFRHPVTGSDLSFDSEIPQDFAIYTGTRI